MRMRFYNLLNNPNMLNIFNKNWGGYDHNRPSVNNTTNHTAKQRFGLAKVTINMEQTYTELLHDVEFIRNAFRNPLNQPKDLPALAKLVELLNRKYADALEGSLGRVFEFHLNSLREELKDMSIKFYRYYFKDKEKPITIEAISKQAANHAIENLIPQLNEKGYKLEDLVDVKVETPVVGVSTKKHQGKNFIWTTEGWIEKRHE